MKINNFEFLVIAPSGEQARRYFQSNQNIVTKDGGLPIQADKLRHQIFKEEGYVRDDPASHHDTSANDKTWQLVAIDKSSEELLGCIRFILFDQKNDIPEADRIVKMCGIDFEDKKSRTNIVGLIKTHLSNLRKKNKSLMYVGGLAVNSKGKKLGYGAILGLATNAFMRIVGEAEGITFAQDYQGGASLFRRLGGYRIKEKLDSFYSKNHSCNAQLLGLDPLRIDARLESMIKALEDKLRVSKVLTVS